MTHDRAHALLLDLAYGELEPAEASEVSRHAAECSECAAELERIGAVRAAAAPLAAGPVQPPEGRDALIEAARRTVAGRPPRRWSSRPALVSFGAAAAVIMIVAGVTLQLGGDAPSSRPVDADVPSPAPPGASPPPEAAPSPPSAMVLRTPEEAPATPAAPRPARRRAAPRAEAERLDPAPALGEAPPAAARAEAEAKGVDPAPALAMAPPAAARAERDAADHPGSAPAAPAAPRRSAAAAAPGAAREATPADAREEAPAAARVWRLLEGGGHVVLLRHAATEPGLGDPPGFRLGECSTQRNLSAAGREEARRLGAAFRARGVPVGRVLSSRWCRCLDTARLAFGKAEGWPPLDSFFDDRDREPDQTAAIRRLLAQRPTDGNLVLVTHQVNITALTGVVPGPGELVVLAPRGDGTFAVVGRIPPAALPE